MSITLIPYTTRVLLYDGIRKRVLRALSMKTLKQQHKISNIFFYYLYWHTEEGRYYLVRLDLEKTLRGAYWIRLRLLLPTCHNLILFLLTFDPIGF